MTNHHIPPYEKSKNPNEKNPLHKSDWRKAFQQARHYRHCPSKSKIELAMFLSIKNNIGFPLYTMYTVTFIWIFAFICIMFLNSVYIRDIALILVTIYLWINPIKTSTCDVLCDWIVYEACLTAGSVILCNTHSVNQACQSQRKIY